MDKELETYKVQLSQVELAVEADPTNDDLKSLQKELQELIELTEQQIAQSEKKASTSKPSASTSSKPPASTSSSSFLPGDEILAKYSGDNAWYPARITSVGGSDDRRVYSVVFKGYNSTELVQAGSVKALPPGYQASTAGPASAKRKAEDVAEKERKKKKNEKKAEVRAEKAKDQATKQASWQRFAKKSEKKGAPIAGLSGNSIFRTPDNPYGRVGVTGSGKGMSESVQKQKHKYTQDE